MKPNSIDWIADLIVVEALKRPRAKEDVLASIHMVCMEVTRVIIDLAAEIRQSERRKEKERQI